MDTRDYLHANASGRCVSKLNGVVVALLNVPDIITPKDDISKDERFRGDPVQRFQSIISPSRTGHFFIIVTVVSQE